jgi:hypothetical protein
MIRSIYIVITQVWGIFRLVGAVAAFIGIRFRWISTSILDPYKHRECISRCRFHAVEDKTPRVNPWMNELYLVLASAEMRSAP